MKIHKIDPCGYCFGVKNALNKILELRKSTNKNIYSLGKLIHNDITINNLKNENIITIENDNLNRLELLKTIEKDGIISITAHGVSPEIYYYLNSNNIEYLDCTCPKVLRVHNIIREHLEKGYKILYLGKKNHPETEGVLGIDNGNIYLLETKSNIDDLSFIENQKVFATNQTTLPYEHLEKMYQFIKEKYPNIEVNNGVCNVSKERQLGIKNYTFLDLLLVIGDKKSSNTKSLVEYAKSLNINSYLIEDLNELISKKYILNNVNEVGVTSGASTPDYLIDEVINYLSNYIKIKKDN